MPGASSQLSRRSLSLVNQTVFRERACASERGEGKEKYVFSYGLVHETSVAFGQPHYEEGEPPGA